MRRYTLEVLRECLFAKSAIVFERGKALFVMIYPVC